MVFRTAVSREALATGALNDELVQRQIAEQTAAALEQLFLDQILDAARRQRAGRGKSGLLTERGHRPKKMLQGQPVDPGDLIIGQPLLPAAVRARHK
jgi:hypothetical protein